MVFMGDNTQRATLFVELTLHMAAFYRNELHKERRTSCVFLQSVTKIIVAMQINVSSALEVRRDLL